MRRESEFRGSNIDFGVEVDVPDSEKLHGFADGKAGFGGGSLLHLTS